MEQAKPSHDSQSHTLRLKSALIPPYWSRLDAYVFAEINYPFWLSMLVYNGIFFIHLLSEVSEFGGGDYSIPIKLFLLLFLSQIPGILFITTAVSFLCGSLFAMRRMSMDSEIIAPLSLGISFWRLNRAVFVFGLFLAIFMFMLNNFGGPYLMRLGNDNYKYFLKNTAFPTINEGVNPLGKNAVMYVDRVEEGKLAGMMIVNRKNQEEEIYLARRASIYTNREVELLDWTMCTISLDDSKGPSLLDGKVWSRQIPIPKDLKSKRFAAGEKDMLATSILIQRIRAQKNPAVGMLYEFYNRMISPLLFLVLALFAVPLAARHSRLNTGSGFGFSLCCLGTYFMLIKVANDLVLENKLTPIMGVCLPLLAYFMVGFVLQVGKNLWWSQYWRKNQGRLAYLFRYGVSRLTGAVRGLFRRIVPQRSSSSGLPTRTFVFPSKLDVYTIRSFLSIFLMVQASFLLLFVLVEYVQISDSIRENQVGRDMVIGFFINKLPDMLDQSMFISLLISILLLFTVMSKNQEIVAIRAAGGSMHRLCLPLVICGLLISGAAYYLENQFLPNTNRNAQTYRNKIRNKNDAMFSRNVWMRNNSGDIINYAHFTNQDHLMDVTRYRLLANDLSKDLERSHWPILTFKDGAWFVGKDTHGWQFHLDGELDQVQRLILRKGSTVDLEIDLDVLRQRKRKASEFSIPELKNHLRYLKNLGYEGGHFETEYYAKYAKPLIPFFMMLLAMPLGIQDGRRGVFYGVAIGFGTGVSFLGFFELFKELGASGIINPLVAGWLVVVVYGFVALYRFINLE